MKEKIKSIMKKVFELDQIDDNIDQMSCSEWDSMSSLNLIVELEQEFNIEFDPEEIETMTSLESIESRINQIINK